MRGKDNNYFCSCAHHPSMWLTDRRESIQIFTRTSRKIFVLFDSSIMDFISHTIRPNYLCSLLLHSTTIIAAIISSILEYSCKHQSLPSLFIPIDATEGWNNKMRWVFVSLFGDGFLVCYQTYY